MAEQQGKQNNIALPLGLGVGGVVLGLLIGTFIGGNPFGGGGSGDPVVAQYNGTKVRASEALANVKTRLFDLEEEMYRTKEQAINDFIDQRLLEAESKKQNLSMEKLLEKETGNAPVTITDDAVKEFLSSKNLTLDDPRIKKEDVKQYLTYRARFDKRQQFVKDLREKSNVKLLIEEPQSPKLVVDMNGYPSWGNKNAKVGIVIFSDFQCPFCSRALPVIEQIKKTYGKEKVRLVFRDMPLPSHDRAKPAAVASHCADEQGKFWDYHDKLFENQTKLADADLLSYSKELKLDEAKFKECYEAKRYMAKVDKSAREAESLGIQATPSFVINGSLLQGAQPFERFKEKIDRALQ